jgi:membrane-associated phospholipid phosphatase
MRRLKRRLATRRHLVWALLWGLILAGVIWLLPFDIARQAWGGLTRHPLLSSLLLIFIGLALSLLWSTGNRIDDWVFMNVNMWGLRPRWLDWLMLALTQLGSGALAWILAGLFYQIGAHPLAYALGLGTLALWLIVELLKAIIRRPRPYALEGSRMVGRRMPGRSFPSGHSSQVFFVAGLLTAALTMPWWMEAALFSLALLVGVTRLYVGAHYPRDVLAGAALGTAFGLLTALVMTQ